MGMMKKKKPNKKIKFDDEGTAVTEEVDQDDGYDIEASDDEIDDTPPKWYEGFPYEKLPKIPYDENLLQSLRNEAEMVLEEDTKSFKTYLSDSKKSETKWMMTMAKSGTSSDKVAALALMVQESPIHNLSSLSSLVNMVKVSKKHQFVVVLETLSELFISDLLRPTKKLRKFSKQPLAHLPDLCKDNKDRRKRLCYWLFEDRLKGLYEQFIKLLNDAAHDSVQNNREKAVGVMLKLLQNNREQEELLISNLINKFGDPVHKVASRVVYGLEKITSKYPKKKEDILEEVERMLFRPHISKRSQYYGICFLSQFKLSGSEKELAKRLIVLYFSFFKSCVKTGDIDSRLMGALLVGVNRAYPYASRGKSSEPVIPPEHIDTMYKVVHLATFKISLQALALLLQISNNDRFYNALYKKLFDKELIHTSHQAIWLNLMMKAIRKDENDNRRKSFVKRILQICLYFPVPLICGTLMMLSQLMKQIPDSAENLRYPDETEIKDEENDADSELLSNLKRFEDDDEDEKYEDVKTEEELAAASSSAPPPSTSVPSSWYHRTLTAPKIDLPVLEKKHKDPVTFDPLHRNPAFAGGQRSVLVELYALSKHFHPTVSLFAKKIINGERVYYTGDPLKDFTTLHFLERFSFKNPKKAKHDRGEEKEELFRAVGSQRKHYNPTGMKALPIQSDLYLNQAEFAVPVDELFLYRYLKERRVRKEKDKKSKHDDDSDLSDAESVDSVEFNEYLDSLMSGKKSAEGLDFADDIETTKNTKKSKKKDGEESSSDDESEDNDELDIDEDDQSAEEGVDEKESGGEDDEDEEEDVDDEESISDFDEGEDEENEEDFDIEDISDDGDDEEMKLPLQSALKKRITRDFGSMAVPTEKFSEMLEAAGRSKSGGSHDIFNRDNASEKQMKWESKRTNQNWKSKKTNQDWKSKKNFNKRKNDQPPWKKNKKMKK